MLKKLSLLILFIFLSKLAFSQQENNYRVEISIGGMNSVGGEKSRAIQSDTQPVGVGYYNPLQYENPLLQLRVGLHYLILNDFYLKATSGLTFRFRENYFGDFKTRVSLPLQVGIGVDLLKKEKYILEIASQGGLQIFQVNVHPYKVKPAEIYDIETVLKIKDKISGLLLIKLGYERQKERIVFNYTPRPGSFNAPETFKYNVSRNLMYVSIGIKI